MAALALVPIRQESAALLAHSVNRAEAYARNSKAENTRRGYTSDWRQFDAWCTSAGLASLPAAPETVALYIGALAETHKPATIGRHLAAIASAHKARGHNSPASMQHGAVSAVWKGIKRTSWHSPGAKGAASDCGPPDRGWYAVRSADRHARPRALAGGLRRRVPPFGIGGAES